jgi:hypothetical protein
VLFHFLLFFKSRLMKKNLLSVLLLACVAGWAWGQNLTTDTIPPNVLCINGLSGSINVSGLTPTFWAVDFLVSVSDNVTPTNQIQTAIRKSGTGTGFPNSTSIIFSCSELGNHLVELWARDQAGNASFCQTYVIVQDNNGRCETAPYEVEGLIRTEDGEGVENVQINFSSGFSGSPLFFNGLVTDSSGMYEDFYSAYIFPGTQHVVPRLDEDPLNGVTTFDLVRISRHILGLEPLGSPYKMIAADANGSNTITSFDIIELRKLILGIYGNLPNNTSWRFVDEEQVFAQPNNPFLTPLRESLPADALYTQADFIGIKIGDVNNSAQPNGLATPLDDRSPTPLRIADATLEADQIHDMALHIGTDEALAGAQLHLTLDPSALELMEVISDPAAGIDSDSWAVGTEGFSLAWVAPSSGFLVEKNAPLTLRVRARRATSLHASVALDEARLRAEAYPIGDLVPHGLQLFFEEKNADNQTLVASAAYPNPTRQGASVGLLLPTDDLLTLEVYDARGQFIFSKKQPVTTGHAQVDVPAHALPAPGVYAWRIRSEAGAVRSGILLKL